MRDPETRLGSCYPTKITVVGLTRLSLVVISHICFSLAWRFFGFTFRLLSCTLIARVLSGRVQSGPAPCDNGTKRTRTGGKLAYCIRRSKAITFVLGQKRTKVGASLCRKFTSVPFKMMSNSQEFTRAHEM